MKMKRMSLATADKTQVWTSAITAVLLILPLVLTFINQVAPSVEIMAAAIIGLVSGVLSVVLKVFFTEKPPVLPVK